LRERNRLDKLERIRAAARKLFTERGFERATTRAIARRANVGLGTLFNYAEDKRDLVFLIFIEELDRLTDRAFGAIDPRLALIDQLLAAFGFFYREFGANPTLSRILLRELTFYSHGKLAGDFQRSRRRTVGFIARVVARAQHDKRFRADIDPRLMARSIFFLYSGAVRWWIARERPVARAGIAGLRKLLALHLSGLELAAVRAGHSGRVTRRSVQSPRMRSAFP
jgi:TetR/AcrR family transcriptional regulator